MDQTSGRARLPKNGTVRRNRTEQNLIACPSAPPFIAHNSHPCGQKRRPSDTLRPGTVGPGDSAS